MSEQETWELAEEVPITLLPMGTELVNTETGERRMLPIWGRGGFSLRRVPGSVVWELTVGFGVTYFVMPDGFEIVHLREQQSEQDDDNERATPTTDLATIQRQQERIVELEAQLAEAKTKCYCDCAPCAYCDKSLR